MSNNGNVDAENDHFGDSWFSVDIFSDHLIGNNLSFNQSADDVDDGGLHSSHQHHPRKPTAINPDHESQLHEMHLQHLSHMSASSSGHLPALDVHSSLSSVKNQHDYSVEDPDLLDDFSSDDDSYYDFDVSQPDQKKHRSSSGVSVSSGGEGQPPRSKLLAKNREHAKNTRMRKKTYIVTLKETVQKLADEKEKIEKERRIALTKIAEASMIRKRVLQSFFLYRSNFEKSRVKWATILDESIRFILPVTPYRAFPPSEFINGQRHVVGINAVIADTMSLKVMMQSIPENPVPGAVVSIEFLFGPDDIVICGDSCMCRWIMQTENAVSCGALAEVSKEGMLKAIFTSENKLVLVEQVFDVMSFMQQLKKASGGSSTDAAQKTSAESSVESRVKSFAERPFLLKKISDSWVEEASTEEDSWEKTCTYLAGSLIAEPEGFPESVKKEKTFETEMQQNVHHTQADASLEEKALDDFVIFEI